MRTKDALHIARQAVQRFFDHDMQVHAAAVTYQLLFSFFPFALFLIALLGFLELSALFDWLRRQSQAVLLPESVQQLNLILDQLERRRVGILSFAAIGALWAASSGMRSMMRALNVVYGVNEGRALWKRYALSVVYTILIGVVLVVTTALAVVNPRAIEILSSQLGLQTQLAVLLAWWCRWPLVALLLTALLALLYAICPDVQQRFRFVTPGAALAVLIWTTASVLFNFYLSHFSLVGALYGSVGTVIVLLLYFFISAVIVLFGAELNAVVESHAVSGKNPGQKKLPDEQQ